MSETFAGGASVAIYGGPQTVTIRLPKGAYASRREAIAQALGVPMPENVPQGRQNAAWVNGTGVMAGPAPAVVALPKGKSKGRGVTAQELAAALLAALGK